jgi:tetratricopeptide (TPR) repeat protein
VQREIALDPDFPGAHAKLGSIYLTMGNVREARTNFTTAATKTTTPADRIEVAYWQAATQIYEGNARAALQDLQRVTETARSEKMPGALALSHDRSALVDAYIGNRKAVPAHLAAAAAAANNPNQKATYQVHAAIALSRIGKPQEARAAAAQFGTSENADANVIHSLDAILALDSKDYRAAETAISKLTERDVLTKALRAELMLRTGRKTEGQALRQEVMASSLKADGNSPVDFMSVLGRMRVDKL